MAREVARLLDGAGMAAPVIVVAASSGGFNARILASEQEPDSCWPTPREDQRHEIPGIAPFVPLLSSVGLLRMLGVTFGPNPRSLGHRRPRRSPMMTMRHRARTKGAALRDTPCAC